MDTKTCFYFRNDVLFGGGGCKVFYLIQLLLKNHYTAVFKCIHKGWKLKPRTEYRQHNQKVKKY